MSTYYLSRKYTGGIIHFTVVMHVVGPNDTNAGGKDALHLFICFMVSRSFMAYSDTEVVGIGVVFRWLEV